MKKILALIPILFVYGCSDSVEEVDTSFANSYPAFPPLPTSTSQEVQLSGAMIWWFWEGDGGCFGSITDGRQNVELHAEADLCEPIEYEEGQKATIKVTYDINKQYGAPGEKIYSITRFVR